MRPSRGSVLVHVLVTSVIVSLIAAGLLRMVLMRHQVVQRVQESNKGRRAAESGLYRLMKVWNDSNIVCSTAAAIQYNCIPTSTTPPGTCGCTCSKSGEATVATGPPGSPPPCTITVTSP